METTDKNKPEEQDKRPDFLKDTPEIEKFGDDVDATFTDENYPSLGNQSQTGAATNNSELDIAPDSDEDDSIVGTDD